MGKRWELNPDATDLNKTRKMFRSWAWIKFTLGLGMLIIYLLSYFALIASPLIKEPSILAEIFGIYVYTADDREHLFALSKFLLAVINIGLLLAYILFIWLTTSAFATMGIVEQSRK